MGVASALTVVLATALALAANCPRSVAAAGPDAVPPTAEFPLAVNRTSKELQDDEPRTAGGRTELKAAATGRKYAADDYGSVSSLTSDLIVETAPSVRPYPSLTTNAPTTFVTRGRFIRNPFYFNKEDQEVEFEEDDHHAELILNPGIPKWNRYNTNHRQLNKYGPTPIEADITVDEDGSAGYGSAFDFGGGGGYDSGGGGGGGGYSWNSGASSGGWTGAGGGGWSASAASDPVSAWFGEPVAQASRPVPIIAEIRRPAHTHQPQHKHMSVDLSKIGLLALLKLAAAKLKALGFIKAMLLVLFKIKLLLLLLAAKSLMLMKLLKLAMLLPALLSLLALPMLFSRLTQLGSMAGSMAPGGSNPPVLVPNNGAGEEGIKRRRTLDPLDAFDPGMAYFKEVARAEKCVERVACRVAAARRPSLTLIWLNWAVSPISSFIPSKKIRSFVSTFTEVTNFRLDNAYSSLLPSNWTEWCYDHYACGDKEKGVK